MSAEKCKICGEYETSEKYFEELDGHICVKCFIDSPKMPLTANHFKRLVKRIERLEAKVDE
jgi:hypothetical protein